MPTKCMEKKLNGNCTRMLQSIVTWYAIRERVKGRSIPLLLYLNQQVLRLIVKMVGERRGKLSALSLLNKRSQGQSSGVTRWGGGRRKSDDRPTGSSHQKGQHVSEKFERGSSVWTEASVRTACWIQPTLGMSLTCKKERKKSEKLKTRQR